MRPLVTSSLFPVRLLPVRTNWLIHFFFFFGRGGWFTIPKPNLSVLKSCCPLLPPPWTPPPPPPPPAPPPPPPPSFVNLMCFYQLLSASETSAVCNQSILWRQFKAGQFIICVSLTTQRWRSEGHREGEGGGMVVVGGGHTMCGGHNGVLINQ